jgi:anion-transporting  ArsA/GET3 family ATPase
MTQLTQLPLTILCGKGGVGKTTLSLALALRHAGQGHTVLVVTSHPLPELAVSVSLSGLKERQPVAAANLFIIHLDPREILNEQVRHQIPSQLLADAVLASRIYKSLIEVAPGLKELAFLGRLHHLAEEMSSEEVAGKGEAARKFDLLIWDAPATGHFLQTLKVSRNFDQYLSGPFAVLGRQLTQFFADPAHFALLPVTTLEEMAVEETIELCQKLAGEFAIQPRAVLCNMTSPLLAASGPGGPAPLEIPAGTDSPELQFILDRSEIERAIFRRLTSSVETKFRTVERRPQWDADLELLLAAAGHLAGLP